MLGLPPFSVPSSFTGTQTNNTSVTLCKHLFKRVFKIKIIMFGFRGICRHQYAVSKFSTAQIKEATRLPMQRTPVDPVDV